MKTFSFSQSAIRDINEICQFYSPENVDIASRLFDNIRQKCKLYAEFPNMGKKYSHFIPSRKEYYQSFISNLRGFVVDDYIVFYYPRQEGIDVFRIISGKQDLISILENLDYEL
jgi:toxin ParE1/3/4